MNFRSAILFAFSLFLISGFTQLRGQGQSIQTILDSIEIDTLINSGPKDNRINFAVMNRASGNDFTDKAEFMQMLYDDLYRTFSVGDSLEKPPYAQYREFFNLYGVWWPNAQSDQTGWHWDTLKAVRDSLWLPWADTINGWATLISTTKTGGGGGAGLLRWKRTGEAKIFGMGWETFLHEFGHTMPGQLDEYSADGSWSGGQCWETPNTTGELLWENIPWRLWIDKSTPLPTPYTGQYLNTIGAFEGAMTNYFGCHRPTARGCYMGAGGFGDGYGLYNCSPCIQRIICFTYLYVDVIENPSPANPNLSVTGAQTMTFKADVIKPNPNTQTYQWLLNGKEIATGVDSVSVTFGNCDEYELTFIVLDTNPLIRYDPKFEEIYPLPIEKHTWTIDQTNVGSYNLAASASAKAPDCSGAINGEVAFNITGGTGPYTVYQDGLATTNPVTGLDTGAFQFYVVDANGCGVPSNAYVAQPTLLEPQLCSQHNGSTWSIDVSDDNYSSLTYLWSTGDTTQTVTGLQDGTYSVAATTDSGCTVSDTITLTASSVPLSVSSTIIPSDADGATGKIYLEVNGGVGPYSVKWYDNPYIDLTDTDTSKIDASGTTWGHLPEMAYDDDLGTKWLHFNPPNTVWNSYEFSTPTTIRSYSMTSADDVPARDPKDWYFEASNNGTNWVILDSVQNEVFNSRFEKHSYPLNNSTAYTYYRFNITDNQGDLATQLQELEYIGSDPTATLKENKNVRDFFSRTDLAPGTYSFVVTDANNTCIKDTIDVGLTNSFTATGLTVVKNGNCGVKIDQPDPNHTYYWFADEEASDLLGTGNTYIPKTSGNYFVGAFDNTTGGLSSNRKGFAVTVELIPDSVYSTTDTVFVSNPLPDVQYYWYSTDSCGSPIDSGNYFLPGTVPGDFYVAARSSKIYPAPIDPATLPGIVMHADASDMDGNDTIDDPQWVTGSLYDWVFRHGNSWTNNWFAYRGNYQNGLGIVDFATIWLQALDSSFSGFQSILMCYKENALSWPDKAPWERLSDVIPRHTDSTQLFSSNAPSSTLNGTTFLNGEIVNPLTTPNPMEFCILGVVPTAANYGWFNYNDEHWEGQLAEILLYSGAISDSLMQGASEFLRQKWISTAELESPRLGFMWNGMIIGNEPPIVSQREIEVYPNPSSGQQWVEFEVQPNEKVELMLIDGFGRRIYSNKFSTGSHKIEISGFMRGKSGMHFVVLKGSGDWKASARVMKVD